MQKRKLNRLKGYDYSNNNLYFVTNCVKNNLCCLGNVISVGTGRDLSVHYTENNHSENHYSLIKYQMELNSFGLIVEEKINWLMIQYPYVGIHNYVIMPNHFHVILEIDGLTMKNEGIKIKSLSSLMGALKSTSSKQIHDLGFEDFAWHRSFHDHIIRSEKSYQNISNYIDSNPQKWSEDKFYINPKTIPIV